MVEQWSHTPRTRVRFPPAQPMGTLKRARYIVENGNPLTGETGSQPSDLVLIPQHAIQAHMDEHSLGKTEVAGSNLAIGSMVYRCYGSTGVL